MRDEELTHGHARFADMIDDVQDALKSIGTDFSETLSERRRRNGEHRPIDSTSQFTV